MAKLTEDQWALAAELDEKIPHQGYQKMWLQRVLHRLDVVIGEMTPQEVAHLRELLKHKTR